MNLRRLTARAVGVGATAALAAGALVGISSTAAQATAPSVAYTCVVLGNNLPVLVTPTGTLPTELKADKDIAANAQTYTLNFTVPRAVLDGLGAFGVTKVGLTTNDFAYGLGSTPIPVTGLSAPQTAVPATGDLVLPTTGKNGAYTTPAAGTYDLTTPTVFHATVATDSPVVGSQPATCTITDPATATVGSVDVVEPVGPQGVAYSCAIAGQSVPLFVDPTTVPDFGSLTSGSSIPADASQLGVDYTIPAAALAALPATTARVSSDDFTLRLGDAASVPFSSLTSNDAPIVPGEDLVLPAQSGNQAFTAPAAGTYDLKLPTTFTGVLITDTLPNLSGPCTVVSDTNTTIGSTTVTAAPKQSSTTKATAPKSVKKGAKVKISVTVTTASPATGKVTAKEGSKSLASATLSGNKATITVKGLKPGKHTIKVVYAGDSNTNGSTSKAVTVTVKK